MKNILFYCLFFLGTISHLSAQNDTLTECSEKVKALVEAQKTEEAIEALSVCIKNTEDSVAIYDFYLWQTELYSNITELIKNDKYRKANAQYDNAIACANQAIKINDKNYLAFYLKGNISLRYQEFELALKHYNLALEKTQYIEDSDKKKKTTSLILANRAIIKRNLNDSEGAENDYLEILKVDNKNIRVYLLLSLTYSASKQYYEAISTIHKAYNICKTSYGLEDYITGLLMNMGFIYQQAGDYEKSIRYYNELDALLKKQNKPADARFYNNRGFSKFKLGKTEEGLADINKSLELYPENSWAYKNRALIYIHLKKFDKACADLEKANDYNYTKQYGEEVNDLLKKYCKKI